MKCENLVNNLGKYWKNCFNTMQSNMLKRLIKIYNRFYLKKNLFWEIIN